MARKNGRNGYQAKKNVTQPYPAKVHGSESIRVKIARLNCCRFLHAVFEVFYSSLRSYTANFHEREQNSKPLKPQVISMDLCFILPGLLRRATQLGSFS